MNVMRTIRNLACSLLLTAGFATTAVPAWAAATASAKVNGDRVQEGRSAQTLPAALQPVFYRVLARHAGAAYAVNKAGCAHLPRQKLKACFGEAGVRFTSAGVSLALHLSAYGRGDTLAVVKPVRPTARGNGVNYAHGNLNEWWRVLPLGFEQGFTIAKRPGGHGELTLALAANRQDAGAPGDGSLAWGKLRYGKLVVTDARSRVIPATLKAKGDRILIAVDDARAAYPLTVDPLVWIREQKVTANDGVGSDEFGSAVAVQGTTAMVGGGFDQGLGAVYVFSESNGIWSEVQELKAGDGQKGDYFGKAIALDGATAFVGAPQADVGCGGLGGHLYVFTESGGSWAETQEFDGCVLGGSALGISIAADGATALVGAGEYDNADGSAFVFKQANDGTWSETQKLLSPGGGEQYDHFGQAVALDGSTAVVGAPSYDDSADNYDVGRAWVYTGSNGNWTETAELKASDGTVSDQFGYAVAVAGNSVLVGAFNHSHDENAQGAVYAFTGSGEAWTQTQELFANPLDGGMSFGSSITMHGPVALIGAPNDSGAVVYQGTAYVFTESNGTWVQTARLLGDADQQSLFGDAVAFDGVTALIGANEDTVNGTFDTGSAYFFGYTDLDLAVSAPQTVGQGQDYVSQTIATNDASASSPAITARMTVPAAASFVSATATQGSCGEEKKGKKHMVTCDFGAIGGNAGTVTANITWKTTGSKGTTILNTASVARATPALTASAPTVIGNANQPPVAKDGALTVEENTAANGTLEASDPDGDVLTFSIVAQPGHGSVKLDDASKGAYTYTPNEGYTGGDRFTFKANDGQADSNVATVSIAVNPAQNNPPVAQDASLTTSKNTAVKGTLDASDPNGDVLTFSVVARPGHGTVTLDANSGAFTYTPKQGYTGADAFTFKANDGQADSNTAKVSITVKGGGSSSGGGGNAPFGLGLIALIGVLAAALKRRSLR